MSQNPSRTDRYRWHAHNARLGEHLGKPEDDGWRRRWYIIIFEAETRAGRRFDEILLLAIVASVAVVMLDSLPSVHDRAGALFTVLEWLFTLLFTAEYAMRILVVRKPWPGMLRGIWGDEERFVETYWSRVPGKYLAGDNARQDTDGYFWIMGRIDDVLNVAGHRLSTIEIESALVSHPTVAEAAAVGRPHDVKGEAVAVFVTLRGGEPDDALRKELRQHVRHQIGAIASPDDIHFTASLPKTRSGKIMRRLLRDIAAGRETVGDTTTLEDYTVLAKLRGNDE